MNELEFGKLAEKTKAMRLMHKKGISLQEAWNIVKSKKSPKKTKKIKSPKKSQKVKLENLKLKELQKLAKKYSIGITQRGNIKPATKELLINRFRRSGKLKEIKSSALKMKFGIIKNDDNLFNNSNTSTNTNNEINNEIKSRKSEIKSRKNEITNEIKSRKNEIINNYGCTDTPYLSDSKSLSNYIDYFGTISKSIF